MVLHPDEIQVIQVLQKGAPGTGFTDPEAAQMRADMDTFLATTIPQGLEDLNDVALGTPVVGDSLVYIQIGESTFWTAGRPSGAIALVQDHGETAETDVSVINVTSGLSTFVGTPGDGVIDVFVVFAGTGEEGTASRSDHSHTPVLLPGPQTFAATGAISSGTRTLLTYNLGPLLDDVIYDIECDFVLNARNDVNSGIVDLGLRIGGHASFPRTTTEMRTVGGVDREKTWNFVRSDAVGGSIVGSGSTVQIVADVQYVSGDPTNVRHGHIVPRAYPRR